MLKDAPASPIPYLDMPTMLAYPSFSKKCKSHATMPTTSGAYSAPAFSEKETSSGTHVSLL